MSREHTWNHAICWDCWRVKNPDREPVRLRPEHAHQETCCYCGQDTLSGIYVREDRYVCVSSQRKSPSCRR